MQQTPAQSDSQLTATATATAARQKAAVVRIAPAFALFFVAPLIAEFLLGNLPIKLLPALTVLAPLYGGGALLIRESARRTGRGWPSIFVLGLAYTILEEAFTTQSLFNPDYLHLRLHLLTAGYIPALGIGAWWTLFMFNLHTAWSISTPIALIEATVPNRATTPWLGRTGLIVTAALFAAGVVFITLFTLKQDHFLASRMQFASAALLCLLLVAAAFFLPPVAVQRIGRRVPSPWLVGALALTAGSAVLLIPTRWGWGAAAAMLATDLVVIAAVLSWSRSLAWTLQHKLALAAGAALAYAWHAFIAHPAVGGSGMAVRVGNVIFAVGAIALIWLAARRTAAASNGLLP
ncbi:MAG TPA: hypothetical protein VGD59_04305 [Acidisarcina sp.]